MYEGKPLSKYLGMPLQYEGGMPTVFAIVLLAPIAVAAPMAPAPTAVTVEVSTVVVDSTVEWQQVGVTTHDTCDKSQKPSLRWSLMKLCWISWSLSDQLPKWELSKSDTGSGIFGRSFWNFSALQSNRLFLKGNKSLIAKFTVEWRRWITGWQKNCFRNGKSCLSK